LTFDLIEGSGGILLVKVNGELVFDKKKEGRWPAYREMPEKIRELLKIS
jgi:predicted Rdx family selenoprotein